MYERTSVKRYQRIQDTPEDIEIQEKIRARANYSLAILGEAFVRHGSGKFLNIRSPSRPKRKSVEDKL